MKTIILSMFVVLTILESCNNMDSSFIDIHGNSDFSNFIGWNIYKPLTPGFGKTNPIYFIEKISNPLQIRYIVELNTNRTDIKEIKKVFIRDTLTTDGVINDKEQLKEMALRFYELKIYSIKVDSTRNVYVKHKAIKEYKQIVKFKNPTTIDFSKWIFLKDGWYQEK